MRRSINRIVVSIALLFLGGLLLAGCGSGTNSREESDPPAATGMLRKLRHADELETSLKAALQVTALSGGAAGAVAPPAADPSAAYSTTYTAEAGVDEFDYVRYDGSYLYMQAYPPGGLAAPNVIRILRTDAAAGTATEVSTITLAASRDVQGMYLSNGRLVVLTGVASFGAFGDLWSGTLVWAPTDVGIDVYDVSEPARPVSLMSAVFDGALVATRRIGDQIYLVSRHTPRALMNPDEAPRIATLPLVALLPGISFDGRTQPLVEATDCYVANETNRAGYPVITTITAIPIGNPRDFDSLCYNESAEGVYVSPSAMYLSQSLTPGGGALSTRIHKFSLAGGGAEYTGSVEVPGVVWAGGQSDFRLSEHDGLLRIVTTLYTPDPGDSQDHQLFVLRQKPGEPALEILARLPNDARPAEIGKPGEALYGVRFAGDRAYAVTFRQTDPLYVIDLANPTDPRIAGELLLPGFSEFLHPVSDGLLLGLGTDAGRVKLELFDVSVLEHPQSRGPLFIGSGSYSHSEALYDRHAFAYLPGPELDRFAVPALVAPSDPQTGWVTSLHTYEISAKNVPSQAALNSAGALTPTVQMGEAAVASLNRVFLNGETVFYVRDGRVWSASWSAPAEVRGPF